MSSQGIRKPTGRPFSTTPHGEQQKGIMKKHIHCKTKSLLDTFANVVELSQPRGTITRGEDANGYWLLFEDTLEGEDTSYTLTERGLQPLRVLKDYAVQVREPGANGDPDFNFLFECQAENEEHAKEQALNAYPEDTVISVQLKVPSKKAHAWYSFADDKLVALGRHESFEQADALAPGQSHWIFNDQSLTQFVEQAIPMLPAQVMTSVPVKHWAVADGSMLGGDITPSFNMLVTDQRALNSSLHLDVAKDGEGDAARMSASFEINSLIDDDEHLPCVHLHFDNGNLAFSVFKRGDQYILRPENQVEIKPTVLPGKTRALVISE